ncbi:MAG TPA: FAD:protein FMN transferase [Burkholderiaceae bacterium]|nr:FAD:protein FMN transferase [Burkholderiaceae bacterium]
MTKAVLRRARPLLGTLVDITLDAPNEAFGLAAAEAAFAAIERVHASMSFHMATSDVSRINTAAVNTAIRVDPQCVEVLMLADDVHRRSNGLFDISVAPRLVDRGLLPRPASTVIPSTGLRDGLKIIERDTVLKRAPLWIDLGGIAKGYAVDRAIDALRDNGVSNALVNAGGDMRAIGERAYPVNVRDPANPYSIQPLVRLENVALATSARYFSTRTHRGKMVNALIHPRTGECDHSGVSVSVLAPTCAQADALTKVVLISGNTRHPALTAFQATALMLAPASTPHTHDAPLSA